MRYSSILFIQCYAILIMYASADPQVLLFTASYANDDLTDVATFDIEIFRNDAAINYISIINEDTGMPETDCIFTINDGYQAVTDPGFKFVFSITIDPDTANFTNSNSGASGCPYQNPADGAYTFYVRAYASEFPSTSTDREYTIQIASGQQSSNVRVDGRESDSYIGPVVPTLSTLSPTVPTVTFEVVNGNTLASVTSLPLGSPFRLKLTIVVDPYEAALDIAAGRLYSCDVDETDSFDLSTTINIIDSDGCWNDNELFENMHNDTGANKHAPSSTLITTELTFVAITDKIEMAAFGPVTSSPLELHFQCYLMYCDSTDTSSCDNSCNRERKKRSIHNPDLTLRASVNFTSNDDEACEKCVESTTFVASTASIGSLVAIVCGLMSCTFIRARQIGKVPYCKGNRSGVDHFHVPSSTQSLKSGASPSSSSSSGSVRKF